MYRTLSDGAAAALDKEVLDRFRAADRLRVRRARRLLGLIVSVAIAFFGLLAAYTVRAAVKAISRVRASRAESAAQLHAPSIDPCDRCAHGDAEYKEYDRCQRYVCFNERCAFPRGYHGPECPRECCEPPHHFVP
jgi:hypothetical protein